MSESLKNQKRVAFFDVDNTLMKGSSLFFLSKGMYQRGFFRRRDILAFLLANARYQLVGERNQAEINGIENSALSIIKGHSVEELSAMGNDVYDRYVSPCLWEGTIEIAHEHLENDEEVWLVTATPLAMANLIAQRLGFTGALGTQAETKDGVYTGKIIGGLIHGRNKVTAIQNLAIENGIDLSNSYAYSDSHHDIPLLEAVGNPRAINPDTILQVRAILGHWPIYEFRRGRWLKKFYTPIISRLASMAAAMNPLIRRLK